MNKVISFDFWDTLYTSNPEFQNKQFELCLEFIPELTRGEWDRKRAEIKLIVDELAERDLSILLREEIYELFLPGLGENLNEFLLSSDRLFVDNPPIPTKLHSLVLELRCSGYKILVSSNTAFMDSKSMSKVLLFDLGIEESECLFSDLVGNAKPHFSMFEFNEVPIFHIGDNKVTDGGCTFYGIEYIPFDKEKDFSWIIKDGKVSFNREKPVALTEPYSDLSEVRFSAYKFDKLENLKFDIREYSKLKYGSKRVAREFGTELAIKFMCSPEFIGLVPHLKDKRIVVASAPSKSIAVASTAIKDYFISKFNPVWSEVFPAVEDLKIFRGHSYNEDYGSMSREQRDAAITSDSFHIDSEFIKGKVLFLIDDVYITGSHERRMRSLLKDSGFHGLVVFLYFSEYIGEGNPNIENKMNFAFVKSIKNIDHIIKNDEFIFNTRVVKYILNQPKDSFENFVDYQSDSFLHSFITHITGNEYHKLPEFRDNYLYLKSRSQ